jgi:hypothetical protein
MNSKKGGIGLVKNDMKRYLNLESGWIGWIDYLSTIHQTY